MVIGIHSISLYSSANTGGPEFLGVLPVALDIVFV
jgi:hypothetical protein